jgi:hypothetical protein
VSWSRSATASGSRRLLDVGTGLTIVVAAIMAMLHDWTPGGDRSV